MPPKVVKKPKLVQSTEKLQELVCQLIARGVTKTIACEELGIDHNLMYKWIRTDEVFAEMYRRARIELTHSLADEMIEIADAPRNTMEEVQHAKLRIETRRWLIGKWAPRQYGDKLITDHTHTVGVVMLPTLDTQQPILKSVEEVKAIVATDPTVPKLPSI